MGNKVEEICVQRFEQMVKKVVRTPKPDSSKPAP